ncbi:MAG: hypothetical protein DWQ36_04920 [Acidobacteria bacterium]|nr:MAG: hypothetical protein DWQ36_04920 [Acidobacteriota bacterium]
MGLVLLHIDLAERAPAAVLRGVLGGYRGRYGKLRDAVMETEPGFRDDLLESCSVEELLVGSVEGLARRWRTAAGPPAVAADPPVVDEAAGEPASIAGSRGRDGR